MTVKGIVEIGGKRTKVAKEEIRKLKNSLDELSIMHIVDDVTFCSFCKAASRMNRIANAGIHNGKNKCNANPENGPRKNGPFEFRELIIPHFYIIDYVSLIQLNVTPDKVMAKVAINREAFINQFMNRLFGEQKFFIVEKSRRAEP